MPRVNLITNLPDHKLSQKFHCALLAQASKVLGYPEEHITVTIEAGRRMCRAGSLEPYCELHILTLGVDTREKTGPVVRGFTDFLAEQIGIPPSRILIIITSPPPHMIGISGNLAG